MTHAWHVFISWWADFVHAFAGWGPFGLLFLSILDSAGIPIVAGVDLLLVTYSAGHPSQAWYAALCAIAGSLLGSAFLFSIARKGGEVFLARHISKGTGRRLHAWFVRYGLITVFVPAVSPLPLPLKVPVFCAGALGVRWGSFLLVVLAARAVRYLALAALGIEYGARTFAFLHAHMEIIVMIAASLAGGAFVFVRIATRRKRRPAGHPASAGRK